MANASLTAALFSRNDVISLSLIFEESLRYYHRNNSPLRGEYYRSLKTLVGLGFTAALENDELITYLPLIKYYLGYKISDNCVLNHLTLKISEMVFEAARIFRKVKYPRYYEAFVVALDYATTHISSLSLGNETNKFEAERLLKVILSEATV